MMFLYAALTALLCISLSSGFTTPLLPEIEETTPASETTQTLEIQTSELQISETTQTETTQTSETTQAETTQTSETTQALETTQTSETTQTLETTQPLETTQTSETTQPETTQTSETTQTETTQTSETTQAETTQTSETTQAETTQTLETTQPPSVFIQKSGRQCTYTGRASDVLEIGCWGYKRCAEGEEVTYLCTHNTVLERDSMTCVRPRIGNTGCSRAISCLDKPNGLFADLGSKCQTYYWCYGGVNYASMYCPATLIFNEKIQSCDFPHNVKAPCGTNVPQ